MDGRFRAALILTKNNDLTDKNKTKLKRTAVGHFIEHSKEKMKEKTTNDKMKKNEIN